MLCAAFFGQFMTIICFIYWPVQNILNIYSRAQKLKTTKIKVGILWKMIKLRLMLCSGPAKHCKERQSTLN